MSNHALSPHLRVLAAGVMFHTIESAHSSSSSSASSSSSSSSSAAAAGAAMSAAETEALRAAVQTLVAALDIDAIALAAQLPAQVWCWLAGWLGF